MSRNWGLAQEIAARQRELTALQLEVETLELENEYYASSEYQELAARRIFNKKFTDETAVYLPTNTEAAKNKHQETTTLTVVATAKNNLGEWLFFLFGA